jgi:hypothetical protein
MSEHGLTQGPAPESRGAIRLIFEYEGRRVRLLSRQRVDMLPPPSDPLVGEGQLGFWVDVRDAGGRVLHHQVMQDPVRGDVEAFSDEPDVSVVRIPVSEPRGNFAVLVPALEAADHLALMSSAPAEGVALRAATELARFSLADDLRGGVQ